MSSTDIAADIKNDLKCGICLELLDDPRVLTCGHTFCFRCIRQDYQISQLTFGKCPLCKQSYTVPRREIQNLSKNFSVNDVLDSLRSAGHRCVICHGGDGTFICLKCKLNMCRHCSRSNTVNCRHDRYLIPVVDLNSRPFLRDVIQRSRSKQTCLSHPDEDVCYFCQTCKRVICNVCRVGDHPHHDTHILQEAVRNLRAKHIPGQLWKKTCQFDKTIASLSRESTLNGYLWNRNTEQDIRRYQFHRDKCVRFNRDMFHLFQFGSDKTILEVFREREKDINELVNTPTQSGFRRCITYLAHEIYMFLIFIRVMILQEEGRFRQNSAQDMYHIVFIVGVVWFVPKNLIMAWCINYLLRMIINDMMSRRQWVHRKIIIGK
ncbi:E3 ubiquitin-protein ligase TRIM56-like [Pecten maximus]|uniref:E3 ubiquitin-protein ligase TRIM56-like n=1 Tax=Pecten maximus TaxID=6579 RepID=UPI001458370C|nr:E3 ubiquitin-protein ligase TRIM56-like [Pecten maximus]